MSLTVKSLLRGLLHWKVKSNRLCITKYYYVAVHGCVQWHVRYSPVRFKTNIKRKKKKVRLCTGSGTFFYGKITSAGLLKAGIKDRKTRNEVSDEMKMECNQHRLKLCSTLLIVSLKIKMNLSKQNFKSLTANIQ